MFIIPPIKPISKPNGFYYGNGSGDYKGTLPNGTVIRTESEDEFHELFKEYLESEENNGTVK